MKYLILVWIAVAALFIAQTSVSAEVTVKAEDKAGVDPLIAHPAGTIEVQQKTLPIELQVNKFGNAQVIEYQRVSPIVRASIERPDAELRRAAMRGLVSTQRDRLERVVRHLRVGNQNAGRREWQSMISQLAAKPSGAPMDVNALIQYVLRESYVEQNEDLQFHAEKVRYFNNAKRKMRQHLREIRAIQSQWLGVSGGTSVQPDAEWTTFIQKLEQQLQTVGEDAQLANIDLQSALQKQQQTMQMMSQVSKLLHDTAMAIIRKVGS
jgi:hypothetical protein